MDEGQKTIQESAKAIQEVSKVTSKGLEVTKNLGKFLARFIKGPLEQAFGIVEDKLKYMRWENQARLMKRANDFMSEVGLKEPTRAIPLKFAVPLFQAASLEDDDELQDIWAKLLVNAANANHTMNPKRAYIDILERISPLEVRILEKIYSIPLEDTRHKGLLTKDLPGQVAIVTDDSKLAHDMPSPKVELALANLARLGCISVSTSWGGGELFSSVNPTLLGQKFVEACTLKKR